ncbi:hypothetical protein [Alicyclobacillus kakegawensis]|uniref:hypothetical protein n=1 Tax=Alicyclobacillus kakegawensis TaxID=392012 RepID=UPI000A42D33D|nr:hypothetical protein [Alicyclobacillus kakegawensis]
MSRRSAWLSVSGVMIGVVLAASGCSGLWGGTGDGGSHAASRGSAGDGRKAQGQDKGSARSSDGAGSSHTGAVGGDNEGAANTNGSQAADGNQTASAASSAGQAAGLNNGSGDDLAIRAFPEIVRMAMDHLPAGARDGAWAPTVFPVGAGGETTLYYHDVVTEGPVSGRPGLMTAYEVQLSTPHGRVAVFGGVRYDSAEEAQRGLWNDKGDARRVPGQASQVSLGSGLTGRAAVDPDRRIGRMGWSEGRWQILVTREDTTSPPTDTAKQVVQLLNRYFLPVPHDAGEILVHERGSSTDVTVAWLEQNQLFDVQTTALCEQPITTAVRMAAGTKPYPA